MRRLALLSVVTFLAACGSSSTGSGNIRFANLSPDVAGNATGIDFCVVPHGQGFANATGVVAGLGSSGAAGLVYGGDGSKMVSKYFEYTAGSYDVKPTLVGTSCAASEFPVSTGTLDKGATLTFAAVGLTAAGGHDFGAWKDTASVATGKVAARFLNVGFVSMLGGTVEIPAFDILASAPGGYVVLVSNLAFGMPGTGAYVDANGYLVVDPASLGSATVYTCPTGTTPATAPVGYCSELPITSQISGAANVVASAFAIGVAGTLPNMLFCADNGPALVGQVYSLCTTALTPQ